MYLFSCCIKYNTIKHHYSLIRVVYMYYLNIFLIHVCNLSCNSLVNLLLCINFSNFFSTYGLSNESRINPSKRKIVPFKIGSTNPHTPTTINIDAIKICTVRLRCLMNTIVPYMYHMCK